MITEWGALVSQVGFPIAIALLLLGGFVWIGVKILLPLRDAHQILITQLVTSVASQEKQQKTQSKVLKGMARNMKKTSENMEKAVANGQEALQGIKGILTDQHKEIRKEVERACNFDPAHVVVEKRVKGKHEPT